MIRFIRFLLILRYWHSAGRIDQAARQKTKMTKNDLIYNFNTNKHRVTVKVKQLVGTDSTSKRTHEPIYSVQI